MNESKRVPLWTRLLAVLLVMALGFEMLPVSALAVDETGDGITDTVAEDATQEQAVVVGEVDALREERTKHFRLSDGSYIAVDYNMPVHYAEGEGEDLTWVDIDNTLLYGLDTYSAENGVTEKSFAAAFTPDNVLLSAGYEDYRVEMSLLREETAQTLLGIAQEDALSESISGEAQEDALSESISGEAQEDALPEGASEETREDPLSEGTSKETREDPLPESASEEAQEGILPEGTSEEAREGILPEGTSEETREDPLPESISEEAQEDTLAENISGEPESQMAEYVEAVLGEDKTASLMALEDAQVPESLAEQVKLDKLYASITYPNIWDGVDFRYEAMGLNIKESIVVNRPQTQYVYRFLLSLEGLTPVLDADGSISLFTEENQAVYEIPAPYMYDASGETSCDVAYTLEEAENGYVLTVTAEESWINHEDRTYPVTIDPTLTKVALDPGGNIYATYVVEGEPNGTHGHYQDLYFGYSSVSKEHKIYMHFNNLPTIPEGAVVVESSLSLWQFDYSDVACAEMDIGLYEVSKDKTGSDSYHDWLYDMTWNNSTSYNTADMIDYATATKEADDRYVSWEITRLVNKWYEEGTENRTIALVANNAEDYSYDNCALIAFYAYGGSHSPILTVSYRNNRGIEPYYTYNTLGAGNGGAAYLADATGQMTVVNTVASYASTVNPVSVSLVYNSVAGDAVHPGMEMGEGWSLDCIQRLAKESIGGVSYLRYTDGDGTVHYFCPNGDTFYDEDGLGLKIKAVSGGYRMSNDQDEIRTFTDGYLTSVQDANGNRITMTYSDGKLTAVTQKNNGGSAITVASLSYSGNQLTSIQDAAGNTLVLGYSGGDLVSLSRGGTNLASYSYVAHRMTKMTDKESDYALNFTYSGGKVSAYWESAGSTTGARVQVTHNGLRQTTYRDYGTDRKANTADDLLTSYLFDYAGRTVNAYTTDAAGILLGASNAIYSGTGSTDKTNNRTLRTASIGTAARNLASNSSFESGTTGWTVFGAGSTTEGYTASIVSSGEIRTGAKAFKTWIKSGVTKTVGIYGTSDTLTAGKTYTLSAWVNTTQASASSVTGGGILLKIKRGDEVLGAEGLTNYTTSSSVNDGWERVSVSFTPESTATYEIGIYNRSMPGIVYIDDLQLEEGEAPSNRNLLENGAFTRGKGSWSLSSGASVTGGELKITGSPSENRHATQTVTLNQPGAQTYVLSGWAKGNAVPDNVLDSSLEGKAEGAAKDQNKQFGLRAVVIYGDGTEEYHYVPFNPELTVWQFTSLTIVPVKSNQTVKSIRVECAYEKNANTVYFDNLSLTQEPAQAMTYDKDGNLESVSTTGLSKQTSTYKNGNLMETVTGGYGTYTYEYDEKHNLTEVANDQNDITQTMTYSTQGNTTGATLTGGSLSIKTSATYTNSGNLIGSVTGASGETTQYTYGTTQSKALGLPTATTDARGTQVNSTYDAQGRVTKNAIENSATLSYTYSKGNLTSVKRTGAVAGAQTYGCTYDGFGNRTALKVGSHTLAQYTYATGNGSLTSQTYGNGDSVRFTYDTLGRVKTTTWSDGKTLTYTYNGEGQLATMTDSATGVTTDYVYDGLGRLIQSNQSNRASRYYYNAKGHQTGMDFSYPGLSTTMVERYTYRDDGTLTAMTMVDWRKINLSYDSLSRLTERDIAGLVSQRYTYAAGAVSGTTSPRISGYESAYNGATTAKFQYTYDASGSITRQTDVLTGGYWAYAYDVQGELRFATSYGADGTATGRYKYYYDATGNLKSWQVNNHDNSEVLESHTYTYGDADWKDLLTAFDGNTITYDGAGNPTSYYDGSTMVWAEGRRLQSVTKDGKTTSFRYDSTGQRLRKTSADGSYREYCVLNGRVLGEIVYKKTANGVKWSYGVRYIYGDDGTVIGFGIWDADTQNEWERYYFVKNLQGDVLQVYRVADNALVASYEYDPFGRILSTTGEMAEENPFRYRGYYYDTETGLYYVSSRYYDPEIGRFINADAVDLLGANGDFASLNLFAYCGNNPVARVDSNGHFWEAIGIGFVAGIVGQYISDVIGNIQSGQTGVDIFTPTSSASDYLASGIGGAIAAIPGLNLVGTMAVGAVGSVVSDGLKGNINSWEDLGKSALKGGVANGIGYGVAKGMAALKVKQISNLPRSSRKVYLRDNFYCNSQVNANANLQTFANSSMAVNIGIVETQVTIFRSGVYSTVTSTFATLF